MGVVVPFWSLTKHSVILAVSRDPSTFISNLRDSISDNTEGRFNRDEDEEYRTPMFISMVSEIWHR